MRVVGRRGGRGPEGKRSGGKGGGEVEGKRVMG